MGKQFDELAKALAQGTSRRIALKRFAAGLAGAALANVVTSRSAEAQLTYDPSECNTYCRDDAGLRGQALGACVAACAFCQQYGGRWVGVNGNNPICAG